jgi:hypothetical protein
MYYLVHTLHFDSVKFVETRTRKTPTLRGLKFVDSIFDALFFSKRKFKLFSKKKVQIIFKNKIQIQNYLQKKSNYVISKKNFTLFSNFF